MLIVITFVALAPMLRCDKNIQSAKFSRSVLLWDVAKCEKSEPRESGSPTSALVELAADLKLADD
jgi:hypothetical protein